MEIKKNQSEKLKHSFTVTFSSKDIEEVKQNKLIEYQKKVKIQGFREGKVPAAMVEQKYKDEILREGFDSLLKNSLDEILKQYKLDPVTTPSVDIKKGDILKEEEVEIEVEFETYPEIKDINLSSVEINRKNLVVEDKDVKDFLANLCNHYKTYEDIKDDRDTVLGDNVIIDFTGKMGGVAFPGGHGEDYSLELGSKTFIPGFEDQLVGKKAGSSFEISVNFPDNYGSPELKGKEATFEINLKKIQSSVPCKAEDLPTKMGFTSMEDLEKDVRDRYIEQYKFISAAESKDQLIEKLAEMDICEIPENLLTKEISYIEHQYKHYKEDREAALKENKPFQKDDFFEAENEAEVIGRFKDKAVKRIRISLIFNDIATKNNVSITEEEVEQSLLQEAKRYGSNEKQFISYCKSTPKVLNKIKVRLLEDKIIDYVLSQVKYSNKDISLTEFNKELETK